MIWDAGRDVDDDVGDVDDGFSFHLFDICPDLSTDLVRNWIDNVTMYNKDEVKEKKK